MRTRNIKIAFLFFLIGFYFVGMDSLYFFKEFCSNPEEVGAVAGTSSFSAHELCHFIFQVPQNRSGLKILEVGGGCGNVSQIIVEHMLPQDCLDIIEINDAFCKKIHKRIGSHENVSVQCCSILDWKPAYKYDLIISTLPFNAFSYNLFLDIFKHMRMLGTADVLFSYIEYLGLGKIRDFFSFDDEIKNIKLFLCEEQKKHTIKQKNIWLNVPPLKVRHLRINE